MGIVKGLQRFGRWMFNIKEKKEFFMPLDAEQIKRDEQLKALALKLQSRDAEVAKYIAKERETIEEEKKKNVEEELKMKLQEQRLAITEQKYKNNFSFNKFYKKFFSDKKFRKKLEITDRNDKKIFGYFGDLRIIDDGNNTFIALYDNKNNLVTRGKTLSQVVYKPSSLGNQLRRGKISVPYDENFNPVPDYEEEPVPDIIGYDEEKQVYTFSNESLKPFIEIIIAKEDKIRDQNSQLELLENTLNKTYRRITDLERTVKIYKNDADVAQTELSKATDLSMQYASRVGDTHRRIMALTEQQVMNEKVIENLRVINDALLLASQEMGQKTEFRKALDMSLALMRQLKDFTPRVIHEHIEQPEAKAPPVQPGEVMK